ncbi:MAG: zinc-ribbon domain-containing protein [Firmicutes bacterium]|nr:zinc-ribbon domain-containing protein [Bacillota bacterium]
MKDVKERVAYLKGLIEGSDFIGRDGKGKVVWDNILEIFDDIADSLAEIKSSHDEVVDYMETIDEDLSDLEDNFYGADDEEGQFVEMTCPNCQETVYFEEDLMDEDDVEVTCPNCGAVIYSSDEESDEESASGDAESFLGGVLTSGPRAEHDGNEEESRRQRRRGRL